MVKKTQGDVAKEQQEKLSAFLEAYDVAILDLAKIHKMKMIPIIQATETGILPVFGVQNVIEVDKRDETISESEINESTDSNNKDTKG
jgi:hypothetical protein